MKPEQRIKDSSPERAEPEPAAPRDAEQETREQGYEAGGRLPGQPSGQTPETAGH